MKILCESDSPIVISGNGEDISIPKSNSSDSINLDGLWKLSIQTSSENKFLVIEQYGQCNINQLRTLCANKILSFLEEGGYLDQSDIDDKFIIYDISADENLKIISVYVEELDNSGEILFGFEKNDNIISNLMTYERKRISKIKK